MLMFVCLCICVSAAHGPSADHKSHPNIVKWGPIVTKLDMEVAGNDTDIVEK